MSQKNKYQPPSILFLPVKNNDEKLDKIYDIVAKHFESKKPLVICVPDGNSAKYVDDFLWKHSKTSFIPHVRTNSFSSDLIVITESAINPNKSKHLLNLCMDISPIVEQFKFVYELHDKTSEKKSKLSDLRYNQYLRANWL